MPGASAAETPLTFLIDIVALLATLDEALTIYAAEPWRCESPAVLAREPDDASLPGAATAIDARYFIEVFVAREFLGGWISTKPSPIDLRERCERLIRFAIDDA